MYISAYSPREKLGNFIFGLLQAFNFILVLKWYHFCDKWSIVSTNSYRYM